MALGLLVGCNHDNSSGDASNNTDATNNPDATGQDGSTNGDGGTGPGTCATPIELATAGTVNGTTVTYMGDTTSASNNLHPYGGCVTTDGNEVVLHYTVPTGTQALKLSTDGSAFNTALYVRTDCSQSSDMAATDLACNDDDFDHSPQSTLFLTGLTDNQELFIVVDGNADTTATGGSSGAFTLTVSSVTLGSTGNPCRPDTDDQGNPVTNRCDGTSACSIGGGAADGTAICTTPVANGAQCDQRAYTNTCTGTSVCASDPTPATDTPPPPVCAAPGTAAGTPCRTDAPRCDSPFVCGMGDFPLCVRTLSSGDACDATGMNNACPAGTTCTVMGDAGDATCAAH